MTLENLFLVLIPTYLVLIAYGVVGGRRRGLPGKARLVAAALSILIVPAGILLALYATRDAFLIAGWGVVALGMLAAGVATAILTEYIARRTGS